LQGAWTDHFWLHPAVPGKQTCITAFACGLATKTQTSWRFTECSSPPIEFTGMFHTRGMTCKWSLNWYFICLHWKVCELSPCFICVTYQETTWMLTVLNWNGSEKTTKKSVFFRCTFVHATCWPSPNLLLASYFKWLTGWPGNHAYMNIALGLLEKGQLFRVMGTSLF
jgi:hypothetical protein